VELGGTRVIKEPQERDVGKRWGQGMGGKGHDHWHSQNEANGHAFIALGLPLN